MCAARESIEVRAYTTARGVGTWWDERGTLRVTVSPAGSSTAAGVILAGNTAGLRTLARDALTLAQPEVPDGHDLAHYPERGGLATGSLPIQITGYKRSAATIRGRRPPQQGTDAPEAATTGTRWISVDVPDLDTQDAEHAWWDEDSALLVDVWHEDESAVEVGGNAAGLTSLARHLIALARLGTPEHTQLALGDFPSLLSESYHLRLELDHQL